MHMYLIYIMRNIKHNAWHRQQWAEASSRVAILAACNLPCLGNSLLCILHCTMYCIYTICNPLWLHSLHQTLPAPCTMYCAICISTPAFHLTMQTAHCVHCCLHNVDPRQNKSPIWHFYVSRITFITFSTLFMSHGSCSKMICLQ